MKRVILLASCLGILLWSSLASAAATVATLPARQVDTTMPTVNGSTFNATCGTLQAQLNAAAAASLSLTHQVILATGSTCTGRYSLPSRAGATGWVLVKGPNFASLPPSGTRVGLNDTALMPKIQHGTGAGSSSGAIQAETGAQRYRLIGIEVLENPSQPLNDNFISLGWGNNSATNTGYFILDRMVIHDTSTTHSSGRAILADSDLGYVAVIDSYISGIKKSGAETQAMQWDISAGPTLFQNNYAEACGENLMIGGGTSKDEARHPTDVTIRLNAFTVPSYCWGQGAGGWVVKSLLELKTGVRVLIEGNTFTNMPENDGGYAHRFTSRNSFGSDTWAMITDLTVQYNLYTNINNWLQIVTTDVAGGGGSNGPTKRGQRWTMRQNVVWGLDFRHISQTGKMIGIFASNGSAAVGCSDPTPDGCGPKDFIFSHNTVDDINNNLVCSFITDGINFDFMDNLINNNNGRGYYNCNVSGGVGTALLATQWGATYRWLNNRIAVGTTGGGFGGENASNYPQGTNSYPSSASNFLWTSQAARDYTLQAASPAKAAASDGTDQGVNFALYTAARAGAGLPPPADTTAPSTPSGVTAVPNGAAQVALSWTASTDNTGVKNYVIKWCAGSSCTPTTTLATVTAPTVAYTHSNLTATTIYGYSIAANDIADNQSSFSSTVYATTTATFRSVLSNDLFARADNTDLGSQWDAGYSGSGLGTGAVNAQIVSGRVRGTSTTGDAFETFNGVTGAGTVAFDAVGGACTNCTSAPTSPASITHVVGGSGNVIYLGCAVGVRGPGSNHTANNQDADFVIGTPTYNGVAMTQIGSNIHSPSTGHTGYLALYRLLAPATGSHTVSIPFTNTNAHSLDSLACGSVSFSGVDTTTPEGNFTSNTGTDTTPTVAVTSAVGNMVLDVLASGSNYVSSTQTNRWNKNNNTNSAGGNGAGSTAAGAASVTMQYTVVSDHWAIAGINLRSSTAATPDDQWSSVVIQNYTAATANIGLACRFANSSTMTGYIAGIRPPGQTAYIEKWTAGTKADLTAVSSLLPQVNDTLSFECEGTALRLYLKKGTSQFLIASATDATVASGKVGIRLKPTGAVTDIEVGQFTVGTFTATDPNPVAPAIASATVDATGANLTYGATTPTNIRVQIFDSGNGVTYTIQPISAFPGGRYTFTWPAGSQQVCFYAIDAAGVENSSNSLYYKCKSLVGVAPPVDVTAPVLSSGQPSSTLPAGTTTTQLGATTNEPATCRYSTSNVAYASMTNTMSQAGLICSAPLTGLTDGSSTVYYIGASDASGNVTTSNLAVTVAVAASTVDTTAPSTVTNVSAVVVSATQVNVTWTVATDNVAVDHYNVSLSYGNGNTTYGLAAQPTSTSVSILNIAPNSTVNIVVKAVDTSGNLSAANSTVQTVITPPQLDTVPPSTMTNLSNRGAFLFTVLLGWDPGTDDVSSSVTATIERCQGLDCTNFVVVPNLPTHIVGTSAVASLSQNTFYRFRGKFSDDAGNTSASYSNILEVTTANVGLGTPRGTLPVGTARDAVTPSTIPAPRPTRP